MMTRLNVKSLLLASLFTAGLSASLAANALVFSGTSGSLAASVDFAIVGGNNLQVTLTNTSSADVLVPADVLTAVFFKVSGNPSLGSVSAITGGNTYNGTTLVSASGSSVGGEWGYSNSLNQYGANSGISSSGLGGVFGPATFPPLINLAGPVALDGLQYGITSAGDNLATGNGGTAVPLTKNSVIFLLSGIGSLSGISNITFQYGTALNEPHFTGVCTVDCGVRPPITVPEPAVLALFGMGLLGLGFARRRYS